MKVLSIIMVRFSWFHAYIHHPRSQKAIQQSSETMNQTLKVQSVSTSLSSLLWESYEDNPSNISAEQVKCSSSVIHCSKSKEMRSVLVLRASYYLINGCTFKKVNFWEVDWTERRLLLAALRLRMRWIKDFQFMIPLERTMMTILMQMTKVNQWNHLTARIQERVFMIIIKKLLVSKLDQANSELIHNEVFFSIGDPKQIDREGHERFTTQLYSEHANDPGQHTLAILPVIAKSYSLPNLGFYTPTSRDGSLSLLFIKPRYRSYEDLFALGAKGKKFINHELGRHAMADEEKDDDLYVGEKEKYNPSSAKVDSYNLIGLEKNLTERGLYGVDMKVFQEEPSICRLDGLRSNEFKIKCIKEWVSMINLDDCTSPFQEPHGSPHSTDKVKKGSNVLGIITTAKFDAKITPAMEAAKNYVSSLTVASTTAQLANLELVVVPYLSAFVSLKVLNLSGNSKVRITVGAIPRGLHVLSLSKNNISTIENLRQLTRLRLRILDLSYNRIFKIGHGLALCSSLKELHLAGNKISEVEGLHRLLKLNVLDLCFNKISTENVLANLQLTTNPYKPLAWKVIQHRRMWETNN